MGPDQSLISQDITTAAELLSDGRRLLIWGPAGVGKSTLAAQLAGIWERQGRVCWGIAGDPGSPGFGAPGTLSLGCWQRGRWQIRHLAPVCTLDAARFRLPLVEALRWLADQIPDSAALVIDAPGVVRGTAAAELLVGIAGAVGVDAVLAVLPGNGTESDAARSTLRGLRIPAFVVPPSPLARKRSKRQRARDRTAQWGRWLQAAEESQIDVSALRLEGTPPRLPEHWRGHQIAVLDRRGEAVALGEAMGLRDGRLQGRLVAIGAQPGDWSSLLTRDAVRGPDGLLTTLRGVPSGVPTIRVPPDLVSPSGVGADLAVFAHLGVASASLVNGIFGDPLLHIRLRQERRSLLFDLGDSVRLPAKIAHQVSDIFVTHAHMDHIGGFLWFLRSRIGQTSPCRLYGPPGLAGHVAAFVGGIRWDRIRDQGPHFEIAELHGRDLRRYRLRVGAGSCEALGETSLREEGVLLAESRFRVRAVTLDHGIPVLAFALEIAPTLHVHEDRLVRSGLRAGPWLGELKRRLAAREGGAEILLPNGRLASAAALGEGLIGCDPARHLVYATDLADTTENRARLTAFARNADVLFCEASFREADAARARRTGHLTARACGEIAAAAGVRRLVPFHFSRRYEAESEGVYAEVRAAFPGALVCAETALEP